MHPIRLNDDHTLDPAELIQSRLLIQGGSGCAKSSLLRLILERIGGEIPAIIIDPEGEYHTIREAVPMVLVGEGGEIPCDVASAGRVARGLLESGVSAIVDLSGLHSRDQAPYVGRFAGALMEAPRRLWRDLFLGIDEAHRFCPQSGKGSESAAQVIDLMKRGRKRGIGTALVTQRVSSLDKDAAGEAATVFIGRTTLSNDIDRARKTLGIRAADAEVLRTFSPGEWMAHGPALNADASVRIRVDRAETKAPARGTAAAPAVAHSEAIAAIAAEVAELASDERPTTLDEAQEQIDALSAQLADARREAERASARAEQATQAVRVEPDHAAVRNAADLAAAGVRDCARDALTKALGDIRETMRHAIEQTADHIATADRAVSERADTVVRTFGNASRAGRASGASPLPTASAPVRPCPPLSAHVRPCPTAPARGVPDKMLYALAWWLSVGVSEPTPAQVSMVGGFSKTGGTTNNARSKLRTSGLIETRSGAIVLTDAGRAAAPVIPVPTADGWHARLRALVGSGAAGKLLEELIACDDPRPSVDRVALCEAAGVSPTGGTTNNALSKLRTLGLIEHGNPVRATGLLNPGGMT